MNPDDPPNGSADAMDQFRKDARIEARMLKADQSITESQRLALIDDLKQYRQIHAKGGRPTSWKSLARHVGVSESVLSETVGGKYAGDVDGVLRKIDEFLAGEDERSKRPNLRAFQITNLVQDMHAAVKQAIMRRSIGVITAECGDGKTQFSQWLCEQHEGAVLIVCDKKDCDANFIIDALYDKLRINVHCRFSREKKRAVESYLVSHTNTIVIVDEAQMLTNEALEMLRSFHDKSDPTGRRNVPILLFGDPNFYKVILDSRGGGRTPFSPQITRRMFPFYNAEIDGSLRDPDGEAIPGVNFDRTDIEKIVRQQRLRLVSPRAINFAVQLANQLGTGRLALAVRVLETALDLRRSAQVSIEDMHNALGLCTPKSMARMLIEKIAVEVERHPTRAAMAGGA